MTDNLRRRRSPMTLLSKISTGLDERFRAACRHRTDAARDLPVLVRRRARQVPGHDLFSRAVTVVARMRGVDRAAADVWRQREEFIRWNDRGCNCCGSSLATLEVVAFFLATVYLPLADVITYYLACPIFVTALSAIVLREQVGWRRWSAVLIGFCGVLIALRPSSQTVSLPALIALGGSTSFALLMLITRIATRHTRYRAGLNRNSSVPFALGARSSPIGWVTPEPGRPRSLSGGRRHLRERVAVRNHSLKLAPPSVVVPSRYSMIVWAVMFTMSSSATYHNSDDRPCRHHHRRPNSTFSCESTSSRARQRRLIRRREPIVPALAGRRSIAGAHYPCRHVNCSSLQRHPDAAADASKRSTGVDEPTPRSRCRSTPLHSKPRFSNLARHRFGNPRAESNARRRIPRRSKSITARAASVPKPPAPMLDAQPVAESVASGSRHRRRPRRSAPILLDQEYRLAGSPAARRIDR